MNPGDDWDALQMYKMDKPAATLVVRPIIMYTPEKGERLPTHDHAYWTWEALDLNSNPIHIPNKPNVDYEELIMAKMMAEQWYISGNLEIPCE